MKQWILYLYIILLQLKHHSAGSIEPFVIIPELSLQHSYQRHQQYQCIQHQLQKNEMKIFLKGGFFNNSFNIQENDEEINNDKHNDQSLSSSQSKIYISGVPNYLSYLNGIYTKSDLKVNNRVHYERPIDIKKPSGEKIHLFWTGSLWALRKNIDTYNFQSKDANKDIIAYSLIRTFDPCKTSKLWFIKNKNLSFRSCSQLKIMNIEENDIFNQYDINMKSIDGKKKTDLLLPARRNREIFGVPREVFPYFLAFMMDAIAVGLAMPLLPFFVMELGANAWQLSLVVSSNYIAQMIGCIIMGKISDTYGRRLVLLLCLIASSISYFFVSRGNSLLAVALARIVSGSFGGLLPIMQSSVADSSSLEERPKYMGRIMATFGMGFVIGPALSAALGSMSTRKKIRIAGMFPLIGLIVTILFAKETKRDVKGPFVKKKVTSLKAVTSNINDINSFDNELNNDDGLEDNDMESQQKDNSLLQESIVDTPLRLEVIALVMNGFLIMYAFATETIYAMFLKDSFGYGESVLAKVFAFNGLLMGIFQMLFIKPLINTLGKHVTLVMGNALLGLGMVGLALSRKPLWHFIMFAIHIIGYSIADTSLVSLISRYSAESSQGRDLALNQAAQSCARIFSPLCAGFLYEYSKQPNGLLPTGALPFLAGGLCPAVAILVPSLLYMRSISRKNSVDIGKKRAAEALSNKKKTMSKDENSENFEEKTNNLKRTTGTDKK